MRYRLALIKPASTAARTPQRVSVGTGDVSVYDARGREVRVRPGGGTVTLPAGGFAIVER